MPITVEIRIAANADTADIIMMIQRRLVCDECQQP